MTALYQLTASESTVKRSDGAWVPTSSVEYQNWLGLGNTPDAASALTQDQLIAYANTKQGAIMRGGVSVGGVPVDTSDSGRIDMAGAVTLAQLVPSHVFDWVTAVGPVSLTADQVIAAGQAVGLWVQSTFTTLGTVIAGIVADPPTITTYEQIDAASWPANS